MNNFYDWDSYEDWYDNGPGSEASKIRSGMDIVNFRQEEYARKAAESKNTLIREMRRAKELKRLRKQVKELKTKLSERAG